MALYCPPGGAMSELRLNVVTKEWVIIAPERAVRPTDHIPSSRKPSRPVEPGCPFCPGNESMTTDPVFHIAGTDGQWETRVVPNKFPVLTNGSDSEPEHHHAGLHHTVEGVGIHEVIIETPRHDLAIARMPIEQVRRLIKTYRNRYNACRSDPRIAHVILFKNHGAGAGTSLAHPHSQLIATPVISYQVRDRIRTMEEHLALYGECVLCRMICEEISQEARILYINSSFVALIPYAALSRFHIWIFPLRHMARFGDISDEEIVDFAGRAAGGDAAAVLWLGGSGLQLPDPVGAADLHQRRISLVHVGGSAHRPGSGVRAGLGHLREHVVPRGERAVPAQRAGSGRGLTPSRSGNLVSNPRPSGNQVSTSASARRRHRMRASSEACRGGAET